MSQDELNQLLNTIKIADNSQAGISAREKANSRIREFVNQLYEFIKKNPGTEPAKACGKTILEISNFVCNCNMKN